MALQKITATDAGGVTITANSGFSITVQLKKQLMGTVIIHLRMTNSNAIAAGAKFSPCSITGVLGGALCTDNFVGHCTDVGQVWASANRALSAASTWDFWFIGVLAD